MRHDEGIAVGTGMGSEIVSLGGDGLAVAEGENIVIKFVRRKGFRDIVIQLALLLHTKLGMVFIIGIHGYDLSPAAQHIGNALCKGRFTARACTADPDYQHLSVLLIR